jgi:hypothetical protein
MKRANLYVRISDGPPSVNVFESHTRAKPAPAALHRSAYAKIPAKIQDKITVKITGKIAGKSVQLSEL